MPDRADLSETPFRLYAFDAEGKPKCLVSTDEFSIGEALLGHAPGTFRGIMYRPFDGEPGQWLINPWERGQTSDDEAGCPVRDAVGRRCLLHNHHGGPHAWSQAAGSDRFNSATKEGGRPDDSHVL